MAERAHPAARVVVDAVGPGGAELVCAAPALVLRERRERFVEALTAPDFLTNAMANMVRRRKK